MKLVASLIVHNEADRYLRPCLEHLATYCDEIVVLDDGSTDDTTAILRDAERVTGFTASRSTFYENEGRARQALIDVTLESNPTHIFAIDADEFVSDPLRLRKVLEAGADVARLCMCEVWGATGDRLSFRVDGGWRAHRAPLVFAANGPLTIPAKKLASGRVPNEVLHRGRTTLDAGVDILHFGWACAADRQARFDRYAEHDDGKFHAGSHLDSILWRDSHPRLRLCHDSWPAGLASVKDRIVERANRG